MAVFLSHRAVNCNFATTADAGAACSNFDSAWGLFANLQQLDPGVACPNHNTRKSNCVIGIVKDDWSSTTRISTKPTMTTTTDETVNTTDFASDHSPTLPDIASYCNGFYQVASGDQCDTIAAKYGSNEAQFRSWNSQIDGNTPSTYFPFRFNSVHSELL